MAVGSRVRPRQVSRPQPVDLDGDRIAVVRISNNAMTLQWLAVTVKPTGTRLAADEDMIELSMRLGKLHLASRRLPCSLVYGYP